MNIVVFGHKRHGKDFACEFLQRQYGLTFKSSSEVACEKFIFEHLREKHGYQTSAECFEDRHNHRALWYNLIRDYNRHDRTRLGSDIFSKYNVYCGIRDKQEFDALRENGYFDLAIWIDAGDRLPPEDSDSMSLTRGDADIVIDNNGTKEQFYDKMDRLFSLIGL